MAYFSFEGDLLMCQWLHANGAAEDISRAEEDGCTPMHGACRGGKLSVCKWLFEVGADGDISRADNYGETPMHKACREGHLPVCKWLYEVGADGGISRANNDGETPMWSACRDGHLSVCEWLVLKGALNDPDLAGQHITQAIVERDTRPFAYHNAPDCRPFLLAWAQGMVAASDSFRNTVLMGTFSRSSPNTAVAPTSSPLSKLRGLPDALELVADFVGGVRRGRELRNARELAECLVAMGVVAVADLGND